MATAAADDVPVSLEQAFFSQSSPGILQKKH
jgi:hypothetical protein